MSENTSLPVSENTNPIGVLAGEPTAFAVRDIHRPPTDQLTGERPSIDPSIVGQSSIGAGEYLPSALNTEDPIVVAQKRFRPITGTFRGFINGIIWSKVDVPGLMQDYLTMKKAREAVAHEVGRLVSPTIEVQEKPTIH